MLDVKYNQTLLFFSQVLALSLDEKCQSVRAGKNGIIRVNRDCPNVRPYQPIVFLGTRCCYHPLSGKNRYRSAFQEKMSPLGFAAKGKNENSVLT
jgi:hypothetical protein